MRFFIAFALMSGIFAFASAQVLSHEVSFGDIQVDGDSVDWTGIPLNPTDPDESSTSASNWVGGAMCHDGANLYVLDLFAVWATIDNTNNMLIDSDGDASTGYKVEGQMSIGAEFLVQGSAIYAFCGTSAENWCWNSVAAVKTGLSATMSERAVPRSAFGDAEELRIVFWGDEPEGRYDFYPDTARNDDGEYHTYRLPPYTATCSDQIQNDEETGTDCGGSICEPCLSVRSNELTGTITIDGQPGDWAEIVPWSIEDRIEDTDVLDLFQGWVAHDSSYIYFLDQYHGSGVLDYHNNIFIDIDGPDEGYRVVEGIGADFLVQGSLVWRFSGCTNDHWQWTLISSIDGATDSIYAERRVLRSTLGDPVYLRIVYHTDGARCDRADYYPDQGLGHFVYRLPETAVEGNMRAISSMRSQEADAELLRQESADGAVAEAKEFNLVIFIPVAVGLVVITIVVTVGVVLKLSRSKGSTIEAAPGSPPAAAKVARRVSLSAASASSAIKNALGMDAVHEFTALDEVADDRSDGGIDLDLDFNGAELAATAVNFD